MEQRISKRIHRECVIRYRKRTLFLLEGGEIQAELLDISLTGARIKSYGTLVPREKISLIIGPPAVDGVYIAEPLKLSGEILWVKDQSGKRLRIMQAGVKFARLPLESEKILHRFVFGSIKTSDATDARRSPAAQAPFP